MKPVHVFALTAGVLTAAMSIHAVAALALEDDVARRLDEGCFEWCGIDQAAHAASATTAALVLLAWMPVLGVGLWRGRVRPLAVTQSVGAGALLLVNLLAMTSIGLPAWFWALNLVCCAGMLTGGVVLARALPPSASP